MARELSPATKTCEKGGWVGVFVCLVLFGDHQLYMKYDIYICVYTHIYIYIQT